MIIWPHFPFDLCKYPPAPHSPSPTTISVYLPVLDVYYDGHCPSALWRTDSGPPVAGTMTAGDRSPRTDDPWQRYSNRSEIEDLQVQSQKRKIFN